MVVSQFINNDVVHHQRIPAASSRRPRECLEIHVIEGLIIYDGGAVQRATVDPQCQSIHKTSNQTLKHHSQAREWYHARAYFCVEIRIGAEFVHMAYPYPVLCETASQPTTAQIIPHPPANQERQPSSSREASRPTVFNPLHCLNSNSLASRSES